jgi:hypothetical protein
MRPGARADFGVGALRRVLRQIQRGERALRVTGITPGQHRHPGSSLRHLQAAKHYNRQHVRARESTAQQGMDTHLWAHF